jgi:hypothetical protein
MAFIQLINAHQYGDGNEQLRLLTEMLGQEGLDAFLGSSPPIHGFNREIVMPIANALIDAGRHEEAQHFLAQAVPIIRKQAGPGGRPGRTSIVVGLLVLAGQTEEALSYAERFGPDRYYMFGSIFVKYNEIYPELSNEPRWQALVADFEIAWQSEIDEFDRRVDNGEIVMP